MEPCFVGKASAILSQPVLVQRLCFFAICRAGCCSQSGLTLCSGSCAWKYFYVSAPCASVSGRVKNPRSKANSVKQSPCILLFWQLQDGCDPPSCSPPHTTLAPPRQLFGLLLFWSVAHWAIYAKSSSLERAEHKLSKQLKQQAAHNGGRNTLSST